MKAVSLTTNNKPTEAPDTRQITNYVVFVTKGDDQDGVPAFIAQPDLRNGETSFNVQLSRNTRSRGDIEAIIGIFEQAFKGRDVVGIPFKLNGETIGHSAREALDALAANPELITKAPKLEEAAVNSLLGETLVEVAKIQARELSARNRSKAEALCQKAPEETAPTTRAKAASLATIAA